MCPHLVVQRHDLSECYLQRALEDGVFSFEDEAGNRRPDMTAVLVAAKQVWDARSISRQTLAVQSWHRLQ